MEFCEAGDYDRVGSGDILEILNLDDALRTSGYLTVRCVATGVEFLATHRLSARQVELVRAGGVIRWLKRRAAG